MVRLLPETASTCVRSVTSKAFRSSGVSREVSPTVIPGTRARASGGRPSVASRSPARSLPAVRWTRVGAPTTSGARPVTRRTAANVSPRLTGGESRPVSLSRVEGSSRCHPAALPGVAAGRTITRTGVRVAVVRPSGPMTSVASAPMTTSLCPVPSCPLRETGVLGSEVTVASRVVVAYRSARAGSGPRRRSAECSPAAEAPAAAQRRTAASATAWGPRRRAPEAGSG